MNISLLTGARVALGAARSARMDLSIRSGRISLLGSSEAGSRRGVVLDLHGCLLLPGLINAHDHLEFGLFPRLGKGPHPNARAWALDIYHPERSPVREHLQIPLAVRLRWGGVRNLLAGVTTVCHHNPYHPVFERDFPVRVLRETGWAHSLQFGPDPARRARRTPSGWPFVIHLGEAADSDGAREIFELDALNALDDRTVLVHAVALDPAGLRLALERSAALVWCPSSNLHVLGRTIGPHALGSAVPIALGTDSPLSGEGDLLDELRLASRISGVGPERLYAMVTSAAASIMRLRNGEGTITEGGIADLVAVADLGESPAQSLLGLRAGAMELVMAGGRIKLASPRLAEQLPAAMRRFLRPVAVESAKERRLVYLAEDMPRLFRNTEAVLDKVTLAGKVIRRADPPRPFSKRATG